LKVLLLSADYFNRKARLKFYEPISNRLILLSDKSNHKSYCYVTPEDSRKLTELPGIESLKDEEIFDVIKDKEITMTKVEVNNPLVIGGTPNSLRESFKTWHSDIKYYQTYIYDKELIVGKWYTLSKDGNIEELPNEHEMFDLSGIDMESVVEKDKFEEQLIKWSNLLSEPIPEIKRMAFDIEVESSKDSFPDVYKANQRVTAISFHGSDGLKKCLTLNRPEISRGEEDKNKDYELVWYDSEKELLDDAFKLIDSYPVVLTYNGDDFDMPYLYNRAIKLDMEYTPFKMMKKTATLSHGIHIDMLGIFKNRSLKIYAFNNKYVENSLDSVSEAILGEHKTEYSGELNDIPLHLLSKYCYNDSRLTFELSHYNNNTVMNLLIILARLGNCIIDDISRISISNWIKSMLYFYHRSNNQLIPRIGDFPQVEASTKADIDGKKYQGAIVLEPTKGVHFDVTVMDFASLYPSIIKTRNVSYETICCSHPKEWNESPEDIKLLVYLFIKLKYNNTNNNTWVNHLKNLEKEIDFTQENIEQKIEKIITNTLKNIDKKYLMILKKEINTLNIEKNQTKNGFKQMGINIENMLENMKLDIDKLINEKNTCWNTKNSGIQYGYNEKDKNFITLKEMLVKNVVILMIEHLKSTTCMEEKREKPEIVVNLSETIGTNYNSCVQIVTELLQGLNCKTNIMPFTKHWACTKKSGIISLLIGSLKELRVNHFKVLSKTAKTEQDKNINDMIAQALKVYLNASYGVIGFENFPLYFLPTAEVVTAIGRDIILQLVKTTESKNLTVLYGDTDSIMIHKPSAENIKYLIEFSRDHYSIDLEVDKVYRYLVLSDRKKNYFGVKKDGKLDIKGLTGKKSNTPIYLRTLFKDIMEQLRLVMTPKELSIVKSEISEKIKKTLNNFDDIPLKELATKVLLNKDPGEYKVKPQALKAALQLPNKPEKGQYISFVKTWNGVKVKPIELVERKDIDKVKYIEGFKSTMEQIMEPLDIDIDFLITGKKQTQLTQFQW